ncbi:MAG: hypothetical protein ACRDOU_19140 [Streptosporangiaceae bacterium]
MRFATKAAITAAFAGPAIAALMLSGAGSASAAVTTATAHTTSSSGSFSRFCNQYQNQHEQNQFQRNQWNLSGSNTVKVKFEVNTYDYPVYFTQQGNCLTGTMTDPGASFSGRVHGTVYGNFVVFSITYPSGSKQGTRTFNGTINQWGHVSGSWSETGSENGSGSWSLSRSAHRGCQMNYSWNQNKGCFYQPY